MIDVNLWLEMLYLKLLFWQKKIKRTNQKRPVIMSNAECTLHAPGRIGVHKRGSGGPVAPALGHERLALGRVVYRMLRKTCEFTIICELYAKTVVIGM